jgi:hypothetical protein
MPETKGQPVNRERCQAIPYNFKVIKDLKILKIEKVIYY